MTSDSKNVVVKWFVEHLDHFCISVGVSILVSFAAHPVFQHMGAILHFFHVPATAIHWLGY